MQCPRLKILRIDGSMFFGATDHVQQRIRALKVKHGKWLLIFGKDINLIDVAEERDRYQLPQT